MPNLKGLYCNFICQILPVALIMHLKILRRFLERISAYTLEYIHKCKILTEMEVVYFKVITLLNLFFLFYS